MNSRFASRFCRKFAVVWCGLAVAVAAADRDESRLLLLRQAKAETGSRYDFALEHKARILPTADERSFYLLWHPPGVRASAAPMIVTLHGATGWAFDEFHLWKDVAEKNGCGIIALQWWFGEGDLPEDYYRPEEMYPIIASILQRQGTPSGRVLLHGSGRGAATTYALAFLDRRTKSDYFRLVIANSGGAATGGPGAPSPAPPLYAEITRGTYGTNAFAGTRWVLFGGELDPNPQRDGAPAMARTAGWLKANGAMVDRLILDPRARHGALLQSPEHIESILKLFSDLHTGSGSRSSTSIPPQK